MKSVANLIMQNIIVFKFSQTYIKIKINDSKLMLIFSLASVVVELLEISSFFSKYKMQNMSGTHLANCPQKQVI
jgi:hypothetical protein